MIMKTILHVTCIALAACLLAGCNTPDVDQSSPVNAPETVAAATRPSQQAASEERTRPNRSASYSSNVKLKDGQVEEITLDFDLGSESDLSKIASAKIDIGQPVPVTLSNGEVYQLPFGVAISLGETEGAQLSGRADDLRAAGEAAAGRIDAATRLVETQLNGTALVLNARGEAVEAQINAQANRTVRVVTAISGGVATITDRVAQYFPVAAAGQLATAIVHNERGNGLVELPLAEPAGE